MSEKINATCSICGGGYYLCLSCKDSMNLHPWKIHCCSADCYKTFQIIKGFSTGVYNKEEFKSKLKNLDLSNLENYREHIKVMIKDTLKEDDKVVAEPVVISTYRKKNYKADKVEKIEVNEVEANDVVVNEVVEAE